MGEQTTLDQTVFLRLPRVRQEAQRADAYTANLMKNEALRRVDASTIPLYRMDYEQITYFEAKLIETFVDNKWMAAK